MTHKKQESDRRKAIERAVRELRLAIVHGEGVDSALDHLHEARGTRRNPQRPHVGAQRSA